MNENSMKGLTRRDFLEKAVALAAAVPLVPGFLSVGDTGPAAAGAAAPLPGSASIYRSLSPREAALTEALVNALCPADRHTPDGVACGLAASIDRQLAGEFGAAPSSSHSSGSKAQFFRSGLAAADRASRRRFGVGLDRLDGVEVGAFLGEVASGRVVDAGVPLAAWYHDVLDPMLVRACYSGPIYDEYGSQVFWKLFG